MLLSEAFVELSSRDLTGVEFHSVELAGSVIDISVLSVVMRVNASKHIWSR